MPVNKVSLMLAHQTLLSAWRVIHSEMSPIPSIAERDLSILLVFSLRGAKLYPLSIALAQIKVS